MFMFSISFISPSIHVVQRVRIARVIHRLWINHMIKMSNASYMLYMSLCVLCTTAVLHLAYIIAYPCYPIGSYCFDCSSSLGCSHDQDAWYIIHVVLALIRIMHHWRSPSRLCHPWSMLFKIVRIARIVHLLWIVNVIKVSNACQRFSIGSENSWRG